jgi:hypothetical protein
MAPIFRAKKAMAGKQFNETQRKQLLNLFQARRESIKQFTTRHGISACTLYKWQEKQAVQDQSAFVEIIPESAPAPASCAMILQTQQVTLHFQTLPDSDWLAELMHNLKP